MLQGAHEANVLFVPRQCSAGGTWVCTSEEQRNIAGPYVFLRYHRAGWKCTFHYHFVPFLPPAISFCHDFFFRGAQSSVQEVNCFPLSHIFKLSVLSPPSIFSMFISGKDSRRLEENSIMDFRNYPIPCNTNSVALPALLNHWSFSISVQCNCTFQCLQKIVVAVQGSEKWVWSCSPFTIISSPEDLHPTQILLGGLCPNSVRHKKPSKPDKICRMPRSWTMQWCESTVDLKNFQEIEVCKLWSVLLWCTWQGERVF